MATRRMFSKNIIESARFLRMPISSQALYFHLGIKADDDGVVEAYTVLRMTGATEDDLRVLSAKGLIVVLNEDLVTFITDWHEHNKIRPDRKIDSMYKDLLVQVLPDVDLIEKRRRADVKKLDDQRTDNGQPMDRIGKVRLGKDRLGKESKDIMSGSPDHGSSADWFPEERKKHADPTYDDIPYTEIVSYLNDKADKQYKPTTAKTKSCIKARWNEGFRVKDFRSVVDTKVSDWKENDMSKYLRPETLFGTKFEGYLNEKRGDVHETEYDHIF